MDMSEDDLKQIENLIKKHKGQVPVAETGTGCLTLLFILFILGIFKGCGY